MKCIVGWNDILGFQTVLENKDVSYLREHVVSRLEDLRKDRVRESLKTLTPHEDVQKHLDAVRTCVISDTIAVVCPMADPAWASWLAFLTCSATLHMEMFDAGLPLRGAITVGDIIFDDWCVLGRPVVAAHKACERLHVSACRLLPDAVDSIQMAFSAENRGSLRKGPPVDWYNLATDSEGKERTPQLMQLFSQAFLLAPDKKNLAEYVAQRFAAHGKSVNSPKTRQKMDNTIAFLQWNRWHIEKINVAHG